MSESQQEIQQLDKRVTSMEAAVTNLTENLNELNLVLRDTTQEIKDIGKQNHAFLDELKEEILNTRTEIVTAKGELSKPNWSFWAIAITILIAMISGGYYHTQAELSYNREILNMRINCNREMIDLKTGHNREIIDLKIEQIKNGKN